MKSFKPLVFALTGALALSIGAARLYAQNLPSKNVRSVAVLKVQNAPVVEVSAASLAEAAAKGRTTTVENLIAQGISPDSRDSKGVPAIVLAAKNGFADTVQSLLKNKAQVDARDNDGATALIIAANGGHTKTVKVLLEGDADVTLKRKDGETALSLATKNKFDEIVRLLQGAMK